MRFSTILIIGIILLTGLSVTDAKPDTSHDLFNNKHYIIVGHIYEPYTEDNEVTLVNIRTGESLRVTAINCESDALQPPMKEYLFDLANLHQDWTYDDEFIISYGHFSIKQGSIAYQQDIQRPTDIDPIFILSGFLVVAIGGGYFYMKKKKSNQEVTTLEETTEVISPQTNRCLVDMVFGGTKKAWIIIMTIGLFGAFAIGIEVPKELIILYSSIIGIYFGAGSVKLGLNLNR